MQIALRPVALRALLLIAGVVLGMVALLAAFAATTSSHVPGHTASASATAGNSDNQILAGVHWN